MNTSISGLTTNRRNGRIIIRTEMGIHLSFKDNGLPLFIPVLVLYDYTTNQIRDVIKDERLPLPEDHNLLPDEEEGEEGYPQEEDKEEGVEGVEAEEDPLIEIDDPLELEEDYDID